MADKQLIDELVGAGISPGEAEWAIDKVFTAVAASIRAGRTVKIDGIGRLCSRAKTKDCYCQGPGRVDVVVACLRAPAELSRGEARPLVKP